MFLKYASWTILPLLIFLLNPENLFAAPTTPNSAPIVLRGAIQTNQYPELEAFTAKIWNYVFSKTQLASLHTEIPAPLIYFSPFIFVKEEAHWLTEQKQWIQDHPEIWNDYQLANPGNPPPPEAGNPFPVKFAGFQYYGSNRIQVNPDLVFFPFIQYNPQGIPEDIVHFGYYSIGHELHHYALNLIGIPIRLHHCLLITEKKSTQNDFANELADFLIDEKMASYFVKSRGAQIEHIMNPCATLTDTERRAVDQWLSRL